MAGSRAAKGGRGVSYVFDTGPFIALKHFYPATFPSLWAKIDRLADDGTLRSVLEGFNELQRSNDSDVISEWAKQHKAIFARPDDQEMMVLQRIFAVPHFQALVSKQAMLTGKAVADPFVIAAAKVSGGTVVTLERLKPNAAKIPNVCAHFGVPCIDLETFMAQQQWTF